MLNKHIFAAALLLAACAAQPNAPAPTPRFAVASVAEGAAIFSAEDEFTAVLTPADISIRVRHAGGTLAELRQVYAEAPQPWSEAEQVRLEALFARHAAALRRLAPLLPARVLLVKNSGAADTALPHTRGPAINMGPDLPADETALDHLFFHELFHVLSRHNSARHDEMYALVGFQPCALLLPDEVRARTITNPDAPLLMHAAPFGADGRLVAPVLFAEPPAYDAAHPNFSDYFELRFLVFERTDAGCAPVLAAGAPLMAAPREAVEAIFAGAGRNTNYVLHPEELLADNFAQLMIGRADAPSPEVQARLAAWLGLAP
jgi:hypothetical protein